MKVLSDFPVSRNWYKTVLKLYKYSYLRYTINLTPYPNSFYLNSPFKQEKFRLNIVIDFYNKIKFSFLDFYTQLLLDEDEAGATNLLHGAHHVPLYVQDRSCRCRSRML